MENTKRALVGDLHIGGHSNSENWHKTALDFARFLKTSLEDHGINDIEFFGDFFDNRNEIGVQTLHVASEFLDILRDFNIKLIIGNHDLFFKNRTDVHSISIFKGRPNIEVIDELKYEVIGNSKVAHVPWGASLDNLKPVDMMFGHFEINGFYMMAGKPAEGKLNPSDLFKMCDSIYSGHFHLRDERSYTNGKKIVYIGTPYQTNWGEMSNISGYYIMDFVDKTHTFVENTVSPRHVIVSSKDVSLNSVSGNIVDVRFEDETPEEQLVIKNRMAQQNPAEIKYTPIELKKLEVIEDVVYDTHIDLTITMWNFVDSLNVGHLADEIKTKLKDLYGKYRKE